MARNLVWKDLSSAQLESIRHPHPKKGLTGRDLLAKYTGLNDYQTNPKTAIHLDLYVHTLQFGDTLKFTDDKLSGLFSIVKLVHHRSIDEQLTMERSFLLFKELLLAHSVQRPPYSVGLFSFMEMQKVMDWMLDSYYRHYKLYMYSYTNRVTLSAASAHPSDVVELAPELPPLQEALTQEQHEAILTEEERKREQEEAAAAAAAAEAEEAERQARLQEEYEAAIPEEVKDRVASAVEKELARLQKAMEEQFTAQTATLMAKIATLEAGGGPPAPAAAAAAGAVRPPSSQPPAAAAAAAVKPPSAKPS
ncbi:hypothetical protein CHLRE_06g256450v5 [Chlamydomonas reinhardtii]|uniref:Central apparatus associated protein C1a-34 n=1 Tax=Chlamydomonas reinhardtii TaxID=3055 RepID=Q45QX4_CHLRE|nr:uncharacterized protein CHLRE_06g256450v5 [Chlamydomonas reinhardtii]7N6G_5I Chain 5I, FAP119 [Chlamydomonas reinhardtii]7N6G_5J Chain 5J, FAP119 [Chlamydomonas reinhardtii]7N6G_5K Chain 5K, FAP119 [Chlamydomonas reinhardtii]7N6G_5L Chain 5L, FAP119 [Chlamydomonas reinhardtii]7SQC_3K Chain 3K, FAP119 [Chlamydomonas reinhardtii]7SQC_3L Chain 3L, FAP119 [Chlamydomonas reinhardtii]7SQC_3M Chain 3M, FAP119 [Chlamydomonas reinhardtii]7SQC_3N Chain 3N, FAP119 [Chlamydomonas reinhardtii]7SQC_3|eukprot:XP_001696622.1 flagellar associated protein [Chlamydomonas reinhardtii]